jgi:hypothetical protein
VAPRPRSSSAATREPRPTRTESQAKNEELFRNVNERIESLSQTVASNDEAMEYPCECDRPGCYERVKASREEYESVRAEPTHVIVRGPPGPPDRARRLLE